MALRYSKPDPARESVDHAKRKVSLRYLGTYFNGKEENKTTAIIVKATNPIDTYHSVLYSNWQQRQDQQPFTTSNANSLIGVRLTST